eukprot:TRINITY_DN480_c0_g4_i1.p1 TRINITY_DN480_c0_g4~~TRINITY_DN480_c0_g4_i1.p1  ORF type:complete len:109 (-),score=4.99 TRINITY_DN480_c0_g4_i1:339-665(-)
MSWRALHSACRDGDQPTARLLLDNGAGVNQLSDERAAPLHVACEHGHTNTAALLLDRGADVNQAKEDGTTALSLACQQRHGGATAGSWSGRESCAYGRVYSSPCCCRS